MNKRPKAPAPLDPGDRAMRAVLERGPDDPERTKLSQEYWQYFREKQARGEEAGARLLGRPPPVEFVIKKTKLSASHLWVVTLDRGLRKLGVATRLRGGGAPPCSVRLTSFGPASAAR